MSMKYDSSIQIDFFHCIPTCFIAYEVKQSRDRLPGKPIVIHIGAYNNACTCISSQEGNARGGGGGGRRYVIIEARLRKLHYAIISIKVPLAALSRYAPRPRARVGCCVNCISQVPVRLPQCRVFGPVWCIYVNEPIGGRDGDVGRFLGDPRDLGILGKL